MFQYRGLRIRKRSRGAPFRFVFYLYLPFLLSIALVNYQMREIGLFYKIIASLGIVLGGCCCVYGILYYPLYHYFKRLMHRRKLAQMILSRRLYVAETQTGNGNKMNRLRKKKNIYFPKIYYRFKGGYIYVRFPLDLGPFQRKFMEMGADLEEAFFCDMQEDSREEGYICYRLLYDVEKNRISIRDLVVEESKLTLMKNIKWDINEPPHVLIAGGTGGGKTYFILSLIYALLPISTIEICDPKKADLLDLGELPVFKNHVYFGSGIFTCLERTVKEMTTRYDEMKRLPNYKSGKKYADFGLKAHFLVIDEWQAWFSTLDTKERKKATNLVAQITLIGRQSGYFLILGMQRPDAKYIDAALRDNFGLRVTVGKMSRSGYKMMFDNVLKSLFNKAIRGRGYINMGDDQVSEFYTPFVPEDFNFLKEFAKFPEQDCVEKPELG